MKDVIFIGTTEINQCRIPVDGSFSDDDTADGKVLMINLDDNKEALKVLFLKRKKRKQKHLHQQHLHQNKYLDI